jgi:hypothetical protein
MDPVNDIDSFLALESDGAGGDDSRSLEAGINVVTSLKSLDSACAWSSWNVDRPKKGFSLYTTNIVVWLAPIKERAKEKNIQPSW